MRIKKLTVIFLVVFLVISGWYFLTSNGYTVNISEKEIQEAVEKNFPYEKVHLNFLRIVYSNPSVELLEGENRVRIGLTATLQVKEKIHFGSALVNGGFRYEAITGEFFLTDFKVEKITLDDTKDLNVNMLNKVLSAELEKVYHKYPIYKLSDSDFKQRTAKMIVKSIKVDGKVVKLAILTNSS